MDDKNTDVLTQNDSSGVYLFFFSTFKLIDLSYKNNLTDENIDLWTIIAKELQSLSMILGFADEFIFSDDYFLAVTDSLMSFSNKYKYDLSYKSYVVP